MRGTEGRMGCGASSTGNAVQAPEMVCIPGHEIGNIDGLASPRDSLFDLDASTTPALRVSTIGPQRARVSWHLARYPTGAAGLEQEPAGFAEQLSFVLQKETVLATDWPPLCSTKGFVQIYAGPACHYDTEIELGCQMRFRVRAIHDGVRGTPWSNEVSFVTQAGVPRRPDAPHATLVGAEHSQHGLQVTWTAGHNGGMPIEQYDVQMCYAQLISIPPSGEICGVDDEVELDYAEDPRSLRMVYSGTSLGCFVTMDMVQQPGDGSASDISVFRFRVQARNAMGYSQWSAWSQPPGGSNSPDARDTAESETKALNASSYAGGGDSGLMAMAATSAAERSSPVVGTTRTRRSPLYLGALDAASDSKGSDSGLSPPSTVSSTNSHARGLTPMTSPPKGAMRDLMRTMASTSLNAPTLRFQRRHGVDQLLVTWEPYHATGPATHSSTSAAAGGRGDSTGHAAGAAVTKAAPEAEKVPSRASHSQKTSRSPPAVVAAGMAGVVVHYTLEMEVHGGADCTGTNRPRTGSKERKLLYHGEELEYLVKDLAPGASYTFRIMMQAHIGPPPTACALAAIDGADSWAPSAWSPSAMFVTPATAPAACQGLCVSPQGPGQVALAWDACVNNGSPIQSYLVQMAELARESKGKSAGGDGAWKEVYNGETQSSVIALVVGMRYKFRVAAINVMGVGAWSTEVTFTSRAVPPEAPPRPPQLLTCLASSVDLAWDAPRDNASEITSYTVQLQIDTSIGGPRVQACGEDAQVGANPTVRTPDWPPNVPLAVSPPAAAPQADLSTRLFTVDAGTCLCTVGDLAPGVRYLFRVRASNEAGPGAWSADAVYEPKAGPPMLQCAPELSSAEAHHVCVEWEPAECNGADVCEYELEMVQPNVGVGEDDGQQDRYETVQRYKISGSLTVHHIKDLASNRRYLFRMRALNALGSSDWSDVVAFDMLNRDSDGDIDFTEIEIGDVIGEGGFSVVYKGVWKNRQVAVKRLKVQYVEGGEHHAEEFKREVELLSNLRHRNIVQYIGASLQSPELCVLTELALYSLSDLLYKQNTKLRLDQTLRFAKDIAKGVKYLHALRPMIIHRDLKSSNLLVDERDVLKISDFGLSRIKNESVTKISGMLGTPGWSAPEIYKQDKYTEKVDMYSYGVVVSEMVTGEKPYAGLNQMQIAFATVYQGQRPSLPDSIPKQLKGLIKACWDSVPAKRPSWEKVLDSLSQMQESLVERGAWGRDARDGSVRPPRLRAGRSLRPPPTPDAPITIGGGSNATPTPVRPEGTRLSSTQRESRRPGSVEVAVNQAANQGTTGLTGIRSSSPIRSPVYRATGLPSPYLAASAVPASLPSPNPSSRARARRATSAVGPSGVTKGGGELVPLAAQVLDPLSTKPGTSGKRDTDASGSGTADARPMLDPLLWPFAPQRCGPMHAETVQDAREGGGEMGVASSAAHDVALASGSTDGDQDQDELAGEQDITDRAGPDLANVEHEAHVGDADGEMGLMAQLPSVAIPFVAVPHVQRRRSLSNGVPSSGHDGGGRVDVAAIRPFRPRSGKAGQLKSSAERSAERPSRLGGRMGP